MLQKTFALTERTLRVDARGVQGHILRFLLAGAVLLMLLVLGMERGASAPGQSLMYMLAYGNAVLITLVGPIFFGNCITEEKEERTLPLLMMADVGPLALLSGKVIPKLLTVLFIIAVQIPFTLLAITLGGVMLDQVLAVALATAAHLIGIAGLGVLCSVIFRRSGNAIGMTGLVVFAHVVIAPLVWGIAGVFLAGPLRNALWLELLTECVHAVVRTSVFARLGEILGVGHSDGMFTSQVISNILFGLFCFGLAWPLFDACNQNL
ncbi:MAG: ABC transporter permease subunit, partial [Planctomycetaceae bacterium]|nr:ABC transporter permease subunit [Planctomycetaceae bacterium]